MGLDQTAYAKDRKGNSIEIQWWRKHNALDGWMESLWRTKGNDGEWNCQELELNKYDIEKLESVVKDDSLPETHGFFYGEDSRFSELQKEKTLEFTQEAKKYLERKWWEKLLNKKKKVFYQCWW